MSTDVFNFDSPPLYGLLILSYDTDTQLPEVEFVKGFLLFLFFFSLERILFSEFTNEKLTFSARAKSTKAGSLPSPTSAPSSWPVLTLLFQLGIRLH